MGPCNDQARLHKVATYCLEMLRSVGRFFFHPLCRDRIILVVCLLAVVHV